MEIKRGDVILMNLSGKGSEQVGLRPCCVVSNETQPANAHLFNKGNVSHTYGFSCVMWANHYSR